MRSKGSVTVFFSLVFVIMFSFILSFFEMAAYTARTSYHASAALLAVENYFAAYLSPLYEQYHIFGREVPKGEDALTWTDNCISEDVSYMTVKREGERSLLLRSGARFDVASVKSLKSNDLEGIYSQAVTAMKYRAIPEVVEVLKGFADMTGQANAHMEIATAKTAADSAYALVDEKILHLIELIDGVDIAKYEKFLGGKRVLFQKDAYVKYFCTNPADAEEYFDRAEVYQAFLKNYENPYETLESICSRVEALASEMEAREYQEMLCRSRLATLRGALAVITQKISGLEKKLTDAGLERALVLNKLGKLILIQGDEDEILALTVKAQELKTEINNMKEEKEQYEKEEKELRRQESQSESEQRELERKKKEQEKQANVLIREEDTFVRQSQKIRDLCDEAYYYVKDIKEELGRAKKVKDSCETVLNSLRYVIGEEATKEYQTDLDDYLFYEDLEGYDFEQIKQTLLENKSSLWNIAKRIQGTNTSSLRAAVSGLKREMESVKEYSFYGLKLNYGDMSLAGDLYDGVDSLISKEVASGFLGFLTDKELSEKELDTAHLPSGFRYEGDGFDIFSLIGANMSGIFEELQKLLPKEMSLGAVAGGVTDTVLFHSYLSTHFSNFMKENGAGALSYEQEYLIAGKKTDQENLSSVAMRICAVRAILHFISLYTDKERKFPVEQAALAACGIIGLPALKSLVEFVLLFVWALEEAMIDTAAILQGKRILLYPGKTGGSLSFYEIVLFSKSFVLERAGRKADAKGAAFGYREYLHFFLFLTSKDSKKYRAADLIQENVRKTYQSSFRISRCVWKITYRVDGREYEYAYE